MQPPTTRIPEVKHPLPPVPLGAGLTHKGLVRDRNEDAILIDPEGVFWAVADGMGGHGNGDVASDMVTEHLAQISLDHDVVETVTAQLSRANAAILTRAATTGAGTMGATVVTMIVEQAVAYIVWAGDSRAYLLRNGRLRLLTRDHTVVQDMIDSGDLALDTDTARHPEAHVVTRAVGGADELECDVSTVPLTCGDRILLCSDGLTTCVPDQVICEDLAEAQLPQGACRALIVSALENGSPDNVSVVTVFFEAP